MSLQVNSNAPNVKQLQSASRERNILSFAVDAMDRANPSGPENPAFALADSYNPSAFRNKHTAPSPLTTSQSGSQDRFLASPSGWARMEELFTIKKNEQSMDLEVASQSTKMVLNDIDQNSDLALKIQANQAPNSVIKLLE